MWGIDSFRVAISMPSQEMFNSQDFVDRLLAHLLPKIFPQGQRLHAVRPHCHFDNCSIHFLKASEQFFTENEIIHVRHPFYNPV
jgi:hypothetical protein